MVSLRQRRITVIWELGGGMGHVARLVPLIRRMVAAGNAVSVIAKTPRRLYDALDESLRDGTALSYYRTPTLPPRAVAGDKAPPVCSTIADVLIADGFADTAQLPTYLGEWRRLLASLAPTLVISDFSPFANMVASDMAPVLVLGSGYAIPPTGVATFLGGSMAPHATVEHHRLLTAVSTAARKVGVTAPESIGHAFRGTANFPLTFPVLDPYRGRRPEQALTPYTLPDLAKAEHHGASAPVKAFIYLPASHAGLHAVAEALAAENCPAIAYAPGARTEDLPAGTTIRLLDRPADMAAILPQVRAVVHSGGLGLAHAGLIAGKPQLILPTCVEQQLTANSLVQQGVATTVRRAAHTDASAIRQALRECLHDPGRVQRATQLAASFPTDGGSSLDQILNTAATLLS